MKNKNKNTKNIKIICDDSKENKTLNEAYRKIFFGCLLITTTLYIAPVAYSFHKLDKDKNKKEKQKITNEYMNEHIKDYIISDSYTL